MYSLKYALLLLFLIGAQNMRFCIANSKVNLKFCIFIIWLHFCISVKIFVIYCNYITWLYLKVYIKYVIEERWINESKVIEIKSAKTIIFWGKKNACTYLMIKWFDVSNENTIF